MELNQRLSKAIHEKQLGTVANEILTGGDSSLSEKEFALVRCASDVCANIRELCLRQSDLLSRQLRKAGIENQVDMEAMQATQIHQFTISIQSANPVPAIAIARELGYRENEVLSGSQWEILRRTTNSVVLTRADDVTMRFRLYWQAKPPGRWTRLLWPNVQDAELIRLPPDLWMLAFLLRPLALIKRKLWRDQRQSNIGEFLGTPVELVPAILNFAEAARGDVIYDLGCGDGRILVEAANRYKCHAVGFEQDESLCQRAESLAAQRGVADLVRIHHADAMTAPVENADIVFLFQPPSTVARILPALLQRLPPGGRIVAHEQSALECTIKPHVSRPLFGESSLTVAHLWRADQAV